MLPHQLRTSFLERSQPHLSFFKPRKQRACQMNPRHLAGDILITLDAQPPKLHYSVCPRLRTFSLGLQYVQLLSAFCRNYTDCAVNVLGFGTKTLRHTPPLAHKTPNALSSTKNRTWLPAVRLTTPGVKLVAARSSVVAWRKARVKSQSRVCRNFNHVCVGRSAFHRVYHEATIPPPFCSNRFCP